MTGRNALFIHESFASNLAYGDVLLWDEYASGQFPIFYKKLKELFRDPESEDGKANKSMEKRRQLIFKNTIAQSKYTNKNLFCTFILVTVAEGKTYAEARNATHFSVHLIVRTRKCVKPDDSTDCCMIFIDECGNVYQNWQHFIETNCLPSGVAFAPAKGVYTYNGDNLNMDAWTTPASGLGSKIMTGADYAAGIGGFGAAAITLAAVCSAPISAPVLAGAAVVGIGAGVITTIRSSMQLWNRSSHEQSISLADSESRNCWLGVSSGVLAVSSAAATKALSTVALAGKEVSFIHEAVVNGMNISTMLISGTGVANGVIDLILKYSDDEDISVLDVAQLAASLVIFTHSVYNFRLASTIVSQTQDAKVSAYRRELSNRQRKAFDKMTKETIRIKGGSKGKVQVVRWINEVPDKQYLNDLYKSNKKLNENNVRFSAGKDGHVVLNNDIAVAPSALRSDIQLNQGETILSGVRNPIPDSHASTSNQTVVNNITRTAFNADSTVLLRFCVGAYEIGADLILNADTFQNCVRLLIKKLGTEITEYLIGKARDFINMYKKKIEELTKAILYMDKVLFDLYAKIDKSLKDLQNISKEKLESVMTEIFEELLKFYESMSSNDLKTKAIACSVCKGFYKITPIES